MSCRVILGLVATVMMECTLSACGSTSLPQEFAVTGAPPGAPGTMFRNSDPKINEVLAGNYCADGYEKLSEETRPTDAGTIDEWRVRCTPYTVNFLPF